jgi:hypothetical protein
LSGEPVIQALGTYAWEFPSARVPDLPQNKAVRPALLTRLSGRHVR